ncbi:MAG: division/cell wall cluster transcriptional repressor MraZ, partial [Elusimicrobiota bacterium]
MKDLIGRHRHKIDSKRRVFIPSDYRVSRRWIITAGLEKCLWLFPESEWSRVKDNIKKLSLTKRDARSFLRVFLSRAGVVDMDSQGRALIPEHLCSFAGINSDVSMIGMLDRIEIWDTRNWEKYSSDSEKIYSDT